MALALENNKRDSKLESILSRYMNACSLKGPVYAFKQTTSTMEAAHRLVADGAEEGALVFASKQSKGRGRLGRIWESPQGGAYFSVILRPKHKASDIPQLSLVAGLALAEGVRQLCRIYPSIRWPNDLIFEDKKLAGILVEAKNSAVVVGVGINVGAKSAKLPESATSLSKIMKTAPHPHQATGAFWRRFSTWYAIWNAEGFAPIREALRPWISHFGQPIHVTVGKRRFEGTATDLDEQGRLVARLDSGFLRAFDMGEVTLLR